MKKFIAVFLAAVLLLSSVITMTSCADETERLLRMDEDQQAARLLELTEKAIGDTDCLRFMRSVDVRNPYYASFHTEKDTVTSLRTKDGLTYISDSSDKTKLVSEGTFIYRKWGYTDGTFFTSHKEGSTESRFKAPMDQKEFEESYLGMGIWGNLGFLFGESPCSVLTAEQKENGKWVSTYEGFSEGAANSFLRGLGYIPAFLSDSHDPKDMLVTLHTDADLRPVCLSVEVLFHKNKNLPSATPSVKVTYDFLGWNAAEITQTSVDLSNYTELSDMAVLDAFFEGLAAREQGSGCVCTVTTTTSATGWDENGQPTRMTVEVPQSVKFSTAGGYRFTMKYEQGGNRYELAYAGGDAFLTVYNENGRKTDSQSVKMLDAQAYETVRNLLNPMEITRDDVTAVTVLSEGKGLYRYILGEDTAVALKSSLQAIYGEIAWDIVGVNAFLDATVTDGVLESYTVTLRADLTVNGIPVSSDTTVTVTFEEP